MAETTVSGRRSPLHRQGGRGFFFVQAQIPIALHDRDLVHLPLQSENTVRSAFTASIDTSDTFLSQPRGSLLRSRSPLPSVGCDEDDALKIR